MKNLTLLVGVAFVAASFGSCKKDRTCTCTTTSPHGTDVSVITYNKVRKEDARQQCLSFTTSDEKRDCKLK